MPASPQKNSQDAADMRGMRPSFRPILRGIVLNSTMAIVLLGFPWYRGRTRAEMTVHAYVAYAACLHGGTVTESPGLALPDGHRERLAALYVGAVPEWPASCRDALDRIPQDEALFLMPGAKTGEQEVRAAAIGARTALQDVIDARAAERPRQLPRRLLRTLDHLAAAVSIQVTETGLPLEIEHLAFDLGEGPSLVTPSRVPLQTANGGTLYVTAREGGLRAVTADSRSAAVVVVHEGSVDITQVRRPGSARGLLDDGENAYLAWITGDATCALDDAHCAHRLTGLARIRSAVSSPEAEVWIAAHPALSISRSFVFDGTQLTVLARETDGGVGARTFTLPDPWPETTPPTDAPPVPRIAVDARSLGPATDVALVRDEPIAVDGSTALGCGSYAFVVSASTVDVTGIVRAPIAIGSEGTTATRLAAETHDVDVAPPTRGVDPLGDHARCAAGEDGVSFAWIDRAGTLRLVPDAHAWRAQDVAEHVAGFAMTRTGETVVFATWGEDGERAITLRRVWHGRVLSSEIAAVCWDDGSGLCGPAGLATHGDDTILYARENSDLLVLRVTGAGVAALPGLD